MNTRVLRGQPNQTASFSHATDTSIFKPGTLIIRSANYPLPSIMIIKIKGNEFLAKYNKQAYNGEVMYTLHQTIEGKPLTGNELSHYYNNNEDIVFFDCWSNAMVMPGNVIKDWYITE